MTTRAPPRATLTRARSEEHTSELQSQSNLVCRLLLEKKKKKRRRYTSHDTSRRNTEPHTLPGLHGHTAPAAHPPALTEAPARDSHTMPPIRRYASCTA